jgi:Fusaric acid resistance protein-like
VTATATPQLPRRPSVRVTLLNLRGVQGRLGGAARGAAAVALPSLVGLLTGYGVTAAVSALGAFAVVYGERRPYRTRWKAVIGYGVALIGCAAAGSALGLMVRSWPAAASWTAVITLMTIVVVAGACWVDALRERAPGAFLLALSAELASVMVLTDTASPAAIVAWTATGVGSALIVAMSTAITTPHGPETLALRQARASLQAAAADRGDHLALRHAIHDVHDAWNCLYAAAPCGRHRLLPEMTTVHRHLAALLHDNPATSVSGLQEEQLELMPAPKPTITERLRWALPSPRTQILAARLVVACLMAGTVAILLGMPRPDWAVITAAMILHQAPDRVLGSWRALHRCIGTVLGVGLLAALSTPLQHPVGLVVIVALLMAGTEAFLVVNYSIAMVFITPLAMILGELSPPASTAEVGINRITETLLGVCVAIAVLWVIAPRSYRTILRAAEHRVAQTLAALDASPANAACNRRRLEYELQAATTALQQASHSNPAWAHHQWPAHHQSHHSAYQRFLGMDAGPASPPIVQAKTPQPRAHR